jgi:hypothetical protein
MIFHNLWFSPSPGVGGFFSLKLSREGLCAGEGIPVFLREDMGETRSWKNRERGGGNLEIFIWIILAALNYAILYWVVKSAIDDSVISHGVKEIYKVLAEIKEELKKQNT